MICIRSVGAVVTRVPDAVAVAEVLLPGVVDEWAVVAGVSERVGVVVLLTGIGSVEAVVAGGTAPPATSTDTLST